jgi:hypothetical protein
MAAKHRIDGAAVRSAAVEVTPDVISVRDERRRLAGMLRAAVGFRVDGPDGRVGVLSAVVPDFGDGLPDGIKIATGLFLVTSVDVPFAEVVSVDPFSRRVGIGVATERRRASRREVARKTSTVSARRQPVTDAQVGALKIPGGLAASLPPRAHAVRAPQANPTPEVTR